MRFFNSATIAALAPAINNSVEVLALVREAMTSALWASLGVMIKAFIMSIVLKYLNSFISATKIVIKYHINNNF